MILILESNQMFFKYFDGNTDTIKYFHDSLNIALILAPGHQFF